MHFDQNTQQPFGDAYITRLGKRAKEAEKQLRRLTSSEKNQALKTIAEKLHQKKESVIAQNTEDIANAEQNEMRKSMIDRLTLTEKRILAISKGVLQIASLSDPIGEVIGGGRLHNGLRVTKRRVPLGVIGIIFESRPNVTVDAAALCLKSGNACILRGGSDAIHSNRCLVSIMQDALTECGIDPNAIQLVEQTDRETVTEMMRLNQYIDVLIPRGGKGLIDSVVQNATVPVIQTGEGICHVYVDEFADIHKAVQIVNNAKTQRPSVCNAIETMLVHEAAAAAFFEKLSPLFRGKVTIYGDDATAAHLLIDRLATDADYATEFNDYVISSKVVGSITEAIAHISRFGTRHSECIVTENYQNAVLFQDEIDAAAVYVNASTRFTDGFEFGLGAEIGISNQKLHARGPMGLTELTTYKYLIEGHGQIRV